MFGGPFEIPGQVLPASTCQFRLPDPAYHDAASIMMGRCHPRRGARGPLCSLLPVVHDNVPSVLPTPCVDGLDGLRQRLPVPRYRGDDRVVDDRANPGGLLERLRINDLVRARGHRFGAGLEKQCGWFADLWRVIRAIEFAGPHIGAPEHHSAVDCARSPITPATRLISPAARVLFRFIATSSSWPKPGGASEPGLSWSVHVAVGVPRDVFVEEGQITLADESGTGCLPC